MSSKKNSGGQQEEGHGVVHHVRGEHQQSSLDHYKMPIYKEYLNHTLGLTFIDPWSSLTLDWYIPGFGNRRSDALHRTWTRGA